MRSSMISILLAGGMLFLGACSTTAVPLTLAERAEQCAGLGHGLIPTGSQTGDAKQDYKCNRLAGNWAARSHARTSLNHAISQGLSQGN